LKAEIVNYLFEDKPEAESKRQEKLSQVVQPIAEMPCM
jgi:plasmid stabilization system protein ParE